MKNEKLLLEKLRKTVALCANTNLYKDMNIRSIDIQDMSDINKLPFTTKQGLREVYPYGALAVPIEEVIEVHTSSGTSGKPVGSFFTKNDIILGNTAIGKAWRNFGLDENSRVMFAMRYGLFSGAPINTYALQSLGVFVLPAGIIPIDQHISLIIDYKIDTIVGLPGYFRYLYDRLLHNKIDIDSFPLKKIIAAGEPYSEKTRQEIECNFNVEVFDHYGLAEVNTGIAYECQQKNGLHILDDYVIAEVVNNKDRQVVEGEDGELVLTSLEKKASPIIRYKTGDLVNWFGVVDCACGVKSTKISRIQGRVDSVISIKGVKVDPYELRSSIQDALPNTVSHGVCSFRVQNNRIDYVPKILVVSGISELEKNQLIEFIKKKTMLNFEVETMPLSYWFDNKNKAKIVEYE